MNKEGIHEKFFEDLYQSQMDTINNKMIENNSRINNNIIDDASKIILRLLYCISTSNKGTDMKKDETIADALKWLKNHKTHG